MSLAYPRSFTPKLIDTSKTIELLIYIEENYNSCTLFAQELLANGWQIAVVRQHRGYCYYSQQYITIPVWAMRKDEGYINYYLSHELAHAKAGREAGHGPLFMQAFVSLCDKENQHHEIGYKTKQAILAGITPKDF